VIYCSKDFYLLVHYIITRSLFMITDTHITLCGNIK